MRKSRVVEAAMQVEHAAGGGRALGKEAKTRGQEGTREIGEKKRSPRVRVPAARSQARTFPVCLGDIDGGRSDGLAAPTE